MKSAREWRELMEKEAHRAIQQFGVDAVDHVAEGWAAAIQADALEAAALECEERGLTETAWAIRGLKPEAK